MSEHIYKRHNKSLLLYHFVFPVKYSWQYSNEEAIRKYIENQGRNNEYKKVYDAQLTFF